MLHQAGNGFTSNDNFPSVILPDPNDLRRRKSGTFDTSKVTNSTTYEDEKEAPGFIFKYYKKFGYYWNVFPKTDYCYLPGSPDYHKEVSPGIPKVPNLSRYPLASYIRRGVEAGAIRQEASHELESRLGFSEQSLMSSTKNEKHIQNHSSHSSQRDWHESIDRRKSLSHKNSFSYKWEENHSMWRRVKKLTSSIFTAFWSVFVWTFTSVTYVSSSVISTTSYVARSCSCLPLLLLLLLLLPLAYYAFPGVVGAHEKEIVTAVSSPASNFLTWSLGCLNSAYFLVKESLLVIPTIYYQLAALFTSNSSTTITAGSPCPETPPVNIMAAPPFPVMNLSSNLTEEKLLALQTEIIQKLKTEMAGQNHHITAWIEQIQQQLTNLSDEMKKMSSHLEVDQKEHFHKLEGELSDLKKAVVDVRDQAALGTIVAPSDRMVERAVAKYHADRTGKPDYALQSSGGYIVRVRCAQTYTKTTGNIYVFGMRLPWVTSNGPETIIKPGVMPGECWAFEGSFAQVVIHLVTKVRVTSFTLEHSPKELSPFGHISSAPKQFSVWALETENDDNPVLLGRYTFLDNGESLQTFDVEPIDRAVDMIELKIESNHGHPEYTCLYRFRVHGVPSTFFEGGGNDTEVAKSRPVGSTARPLKPYR